MVAAKARIFLVIISLVAFGGNADAQLGPALKGQNPIELVVEGLDEDATKCGASKDSLEAAMRIPLSNSPIKVREKAFPYLKTTVSALKLNDRSCAVSVLIEFRRMMWSSKGEDAELDFVSAWRDGTMLTGSSTTMGRRVAEAVEGLTKIFIGAWLKANF